MYLCQHGVTLKYVSPIEIVIIGGAQFTHMLNIGTVPLYNLRNKTFRQTKKVWALCVSEKGNGKLIVTKRTTRKIDHFRY